jgi:O-acetyl-ADP-ribose deacetylase (regulator of RNase III)
VSSGGFGAVGVEALGLPAISGGVGGCQCGGFRAASDF